MTNGREHLAWITRFQLVLAPLGAVLWTLKSGRAALVFGVGAAASLASWALHRWAVGRMLTPSLRQRWFYGIVGASKLALIVFLLRAMMGCFPTEVLPLVTGLLLFVAAILLEAVRLGFTPPEQEGGPDGHPRG